MPEIIYLLDIRGTPETRYVCCDAIYIYIYMYTYDLNMDKYGHVSPEV